MLTIWGRENSNNVRKVLWCAAELGLSYTHINAGGAFGKVNEESYRALNPNGLVPLLQDDDFVLWESNTIVRYLAAKFGDAICRRAPPPRNGWTGPPQPSFRPSPSSFGA
jgi:glutathione S-transferase